MNSNALPKTDKSLAVLTTINTVCGIAEYSRDLYSALIPKFKEFHYIANRDVADRTRPDSAEVVRLWEYGELSFGSVLAWLAAEQPDYFHIQLHSSAHYPLAGLIALLHGIKELQIPTKVVITPHTVLSKSFDLAVIKTELVDVDRILVHRPVDLEYLQSQGLQNVELFNHPYDSYPRRDRMQIRSQLKLQQSPIVITHGLVSEHKGLVQMAEAIAELRAKYPQILWLAVNAINMNNSTSAATHAAMEQKISELGIQDHVRLFPEFLSSEEVMILIQSADLGVCAYSEVGESASGVIRKFLSSGTPTIVTDIPMMQELDHEVMKIADSAPHTIAAGIEKLLSDSSLKETIVKAALDKSGMFSWEKMQQKLLEIYSAL